LATTGSALTREGLTACELLSDANQTTTLRTDPKMSTVLITLVNFTEFPPQVNEPAYFSLADKMHALIKKLGRALRFQHSRCPFQQVICLARNYCAWDGLSV
jgi:hypothetical protein